MDELFGPDSRTEAEKLQGLRQQALYMVGDKSRSGAEIVADAKVIFAFLVNGE